MNRTQIILDRPLKIEIKRYSDLQGQSVSHTIRLGMKEYLKKYQKRHSVGVKGLQRLANLSKKGGNKNLSKTMDKVLY